MFGIEMKFDNAGLYQLINELRQAADKTEVTLVVATSLVGEMRTRIHEQGKASDGSQIGVYSPGYMKVRTGQFATNSTVTKGKKKGETRTTGTFTKGAQKGSQRPSYNRGNDTTVILSLTRQQEQDFSIIEVNGQYGIGYKNDLNFQKSQWEEKTYKKPIFDLTTEEKNLAQETLNTYITNAIH